MAGAWAFLSAPARDIVTRFALHASGISQDARWLSAHMARQCPAFSIQGSRISHAQSLLLRVAAGQFLTNLLPSEGYMGHAQYCRDKTSCWSQMNKWALASSYHAHIALEVAAMYQGACFAGDREADVHGCSQVHDGQPEQACEGGGRLCQHPQRGQHGAGAQCTEAVQALIERCPYDVP